MNRRPSVLVAMSGGVDSSVSAALLHERGYRVVGEHMKLVHLDGVDHGCCGPQAEADARSVAETVGFEFRIVDMNDEFERTVLADFYAEHRGGRTPNPCIRCNEHIKFGAFLERARRLGFDHVATGHYVRTWSDEAGRWHLGRGLDRSKDQSYLLHTLGQRELSMAVFPVGEQSKAETRAIAEGLGLVVAGKPDSQEVCFVPGADHAAFLAEHAPDLVRPGAVVDADGARLADHQGAFRFTIGQRRGLGVSTGERLYVLDVDAPSNRVVVGPGELLARRGLRADRFSWVVGEPPGTGPFEATARIRYRGDDVPAVIEPQRPDRVTVEFRSPQRGVSPGQSVVVYRGDEVLGGGRITESLR
ncbi:MAG TPA: tRNA 2-thiouridine(34) synthase MnmA [Actinomycetota bacterium]|nr:tRNA 2-thiouridine(34) synthase MnmA [Actinomycetota bacterium]